MLAGLSVLFSQFIRASSSHRPKVGIACLAAVLHQLRPPQLHRGGADSRRHNARHGVPGIGPAAVRRGVRFRAVLDDTFEMERILHLSRNGFFILDGTTLSKPEPVAGGCPGATSANRTAGWRTFCRPSRYALAGTERPIWTGRCARARPGRFFDVTVLTIKLWAVLGRRYVWRYRSGRPRRARRPHT